MHFDVFVVCYSTVITLALVWRRRLFKNNWIRLLRVCGFLVPTCFIADSVAERQHFWRFRRTSGFMVLYVPLETLLFTVATVILILIFFLQTRDFFRGSKRQQSN